MSCVGSFTSCLSREVHRPTVREVDGVAEEFLSHSQEVDGVAEEFLGHSQEVDGVAEEFLGHSQEVDGVAEEFMGHSQGLQVEHQGRSRHSPRRFKRTALHGLQIEFN